MQPSLTIADPATDFCEPIATSRFVEFVDAFNHREFAFADAMITQDADFWGFAEAPDRRADAVPTPDRSTVRAFLESRAAINEFWVIKGFGYEPYQPTLARPGSFISFAILVSNDSGVVVRDGKGFVHCATDKIDNFVIGPTLEEHADPRPTTDLAACEAGAKQLGVDGGVLLVAPTIAVSREGRAVIGCTVHKLSTDAWVLFEVDRDTGKAAIAAGS